MLRLRSTPVLLTLAGPTAAAVVSAVLAVACAPPSSRIAPVALGPEGGDTPGQRPACSCELRSWVVAGHGRHLLLDIDCPPPFEALTGVVEFANTAMREDFDWTRDPLGAPRIARMTPGVRIRSALGEAPERVEARWTLSPSVAACLQRDRVFAFAYFLVGPNSNSAMRAACESCDVHLPEAVLTSGGLLGEFPGVERSPGDELPRDQWTIAGWRAPDETRRAENAPK